MKWEQGQDDNGCWGMKKEMSHSKKFTVIYTSYQKTGTDPTAGKFLKSLITVNLVLVCSWLHNPSFVQGTPATTETVH